MKRISTLLFALLFALLPVLHASVYLVNSDPCIIRHALVKMFTCFYCPQVNCTTINVDVSYGTPSAFDDNSVRPLRVYVLDRLIADVWKFPAGKPEP